MLAATLNGVLLLDRLARVDAGLFDGHRLAAATTVDLLARLGRRRRALAAAGRVVDALAATGPLAPPLPRHREA